MRGRKADFLSEIRELMGKVALVLMSKEKYSKFSAFLNLLLSLLGVVYNNNRNTGKIEQTTPQSHVQKLSFR